MICKGLSRIRRFSYLFVGKNLFSSSQFQIEKSACIDHLKEWPGIYRLPINDLLRQIANDSELEINHIKSLNIDPKILSEYISIYRRRLMKNPIDFFGDVKSFQYFIDAL